VLQHLRGGSGPGTLLRLAHNPIDLRPLALEDRNKTTVLPVPDRWILKADLKAVAKEAGGFRVPDEVAEVYLLGVPFAEISEKFRTEWLEDLRLAEHAAFYRGKEGVDPDEAAAYMTAVRVRLWKRRKDFRGDER